MNKLLTLFLCVVALSGIAFAINPGATTILSPTNGQAVNNSNPALFSVMNNSFVVAFNWNNSNGTNTVNATLLMNGARVGKISVDNRSAGVNVVYNLTSNISFPDGRYLISILTENDTTTNATANITVFIDGTDPRPPVFIDSVDNNTPDDGNVTTNTGNIQIFGIHQGDNVFNDRQTLRLFFNGTLNSTFNVANYTTVNVTIQGLSTGNYTYFWRVYDNATNVAQSATRRLTVDSGQPTITFVNAVAASTGRDYLMVSRYTAADYTLASACYAKVYDTNGASVITTGLFNVSGTRCEVNSTGTLNSTSLVDGRVIVEYHANDSLGNDRAGFNLTNLTSIRFYPGMNMFSADRNTSLSAIANYSTTIQSVSVWSNLNKTFTTYTVGVSTNANVVVTDGDGIYIYANSSGVLVRNWTLDCFNCGGTYGRNFTVNGSLNLVSAYNFTITLGQLCAEAIPANGIINTLATTNISSVSVWLNNESRYYSHGCNPNTLPNSNLVVSLGQPYWINMNQSVAIQAGYMRRRMP